MADSPHPTAQNRAIEPGRVGDGLDGSSDSAEVQALRQRVTSLTAENQALRMELDALRARMLAAQVEEPIDA